jgi:hypothetical protein
VKPAKFLQIQVKVVGVPLDASDGSSDDGSWGPVDFWKPAQGALSLTIVLTAFFSAEGIFQILASLPYRDVGTDIWAGATPRFISAEKKTASGICPTAMLSVRECPFRSSPEALRKNSFAFG